MDLNSLSLLNKIESIEDFAELYSVELPKEPTKPGISLRVKSSS